ARSVSDGTLASDYEPQRSLIEAAAALGVGMPGEARRVLEGLRQRGWAQAEVRPGLTAGQTDAVLEWLAETVAAADAQFVEPGVEEATVAFNPASAPGWVAGDWRLPGGGPRHNRVCDAGLPHLWARWSAVVEADPAREATLAAFAYKLQSDKRPATPVGQPVAVGDTVLVRTSQNLVAIDFNTGRRLWETRPDHAAAVSDQQQAWYRRVAQQSESAALSREAIRGWYDRVGASVAADDLHAYVIEAVPRATASEAQWSPFARQRAWMEAMLGEASNRLAAYSLTTQGKLAWSVGGSGGGPLADAYFLSAPQPLGNDLVAVAEVDQTICLVLLDRSSGGLLWRQPLVSVERGVDQNSMRRLAGASIAQAGADVICSTGAGVVVSVDMLNRSINWVDRFPVKEGREAIDSMPWRRRPRDVWPQNAKQGWLENRLIVAGGRVLVASPESPALHCLDLRTGAAQWRQKRDSSTHVVAAAGGVVVVNDADSVSGLDLATGKRVWAAEELGGGVVSGRCLLAQGKVLAPLSEGSIAVIDAAGGELVDRLECWSGGGAGNLIFHRGAFLSHTASALDRYDQRAVLMRMVDARPLVDSAAARRRISTQRARQAETARLCIEGESLLVEGRLDVAIKRFGQAYELDRSSPLARQRLRTALMLRLQEPGLSQPDLDRLSRLVDSPTQRMALNVRMVQLAIGDNRLSSAIGPSAKLLREPGSGTTLIRVQAGRFATPARCVTGLLARAWGQASSKVRELSAQSLKRQHDSFATVAGRRRFAEVFAELPELAGFEAAGPLQPGELSLLRLRRAEAAMQGRSAPWDTSTGATATDRRWSTRQAIAEVEREETDAEDTRRYRFGRRRVAGKRHVASRVVAADPAGVNAPDGIVDFAVDAEAGQLLGFDSRGDEVYRTVLQGPGGGFVRRVFSQPDTRIWRLGPCVYVSTGQDILAFETLPGGEGGDRCLWTTDGLTQKLLRQTRSAGGGPLARPNRAPVIEPAAAATIVAVSARGVVFRKGDVLVCVDPLSGGPLWLREAEGLRDEATAHGAYVYATVTGGPGRRLSMIDGADAGEWASPAGKWLSSGRGLVTTFHRNTVTVTDVATGQAVLERRYKLMQPSPTGPQLQVIEGAVVTLQQDGTLEIIDTHAGRLVASTKLNVAGTARLLPPVIRGDRLLVTLDYASVNTNGASRLVSLDPGTSAVGESAGEVRCFDLASGRQVWPRPVQIERRALLQRLPLGAPLLVFGAKTDSASNRRINPVTRILVVDAATGRTVYRDDGLPGDGAGVYAVTYSGGQSPRLRISLPQAQVTLRLSDRPLPPGPPATDAVETGVTINRSVNGFMRQFQKVMRGAVQPKKPGGE
ncbi:MAG: PQQ-binding-like beta-propeller repeat protein, partial [Planctomycetota bacterium]